MRNLLRVGVGLVTILMAGLALGAGTITVTSPARGTLAAPTPIKGNAPINFNITGGQTEVTVTVRLFRLDLNQQYGQPLTVKVTPNTDGKVSGSVSFQFSQGIDPEVAYRAEVRATETGGNLYNTDQDLFVKPDLTKPKILSFNPLGGSFVKGNVLISVQVLEANLKDWRVQVDGNTLPNGEGTTVNSQGYFTVTWATNGIQFDGSKTISIRIRDLAENETTQDIPVTIDRVAPRLTIQSPLNNSSFAAGTTLTVIADVTDASTASVPVTGLDVVVRKMDGTFITRVARQSFTSLNGTTSRWTGRIRWRAGLLPPQFKIIVTATDKAGNVATPQTVTVNIG